MLDTFLSNTGIVAKQVIILYVIVLIGIIADKTKLFTEKVARACTDLLFYIITPAVIINSFITESFSKDSATKLLISVGCGFLIHIIGIAISAPFFNKCENGNGAIYKFASIYGNVGYMTLPLTAAVLGSEGVFFCSGVVMAFNVVVFTHGIIIMDKKSGGFDLKKLILNPGVISVLVGLPVYLLKIHLPEVISQPIAYIYDMQTPFAMLVFGTYLSNTKLKTMFEHKEIYLASALKLIVLPVIMFLLYRLFGLSGTLMTALMISSCAPSANNTVIFSAKYGKDTGLASQMVAVCSFLSIITMPLVVAFVKTLGQ